MTEPTTTSTPETAAAAAAAPVAVAVRLPGPLRALADGSEVAEVRGATVARALDDLLVRYPALQRHLRTEAGALREHVNLFVNDDDVRYLDGEATALVEGDTITIVPSIAGG